MRCLTAGESHGRGIVAILEGMPAGLKVSEGRVNGELKRRQQGFGRGRRMQIERDRVQVISGLKRQKTLGSPIGLLIENKDFSIERLHRVTNARPGHADLAGYLKYGAGDIREVLERASARSTAATVAVGAVCKIFLKQVGITFAGKTVLIGGETAPSAMKRKITEAIRLKDTVGGVCEVYARGVPVGLGSYTQSDRRLDARIAGAVMGIPGIKAVEIGLGFGYAEYFGSEVHDALSYRRATGYSRATNNAGGIEGGISNGEEIVVRACMKPISTLMNPLDSVNVKTKKKAKAATERSDTCVVEAAGVVAESACAFVLADAFLEKFGQDTMVDIQGAYREYRARLKKS